MNKIELLLSWGFKVTNSHVEIYRLDLKDIRIDVYTSYDSFGFDDVQLITVNEDGDTCYCSLDKVKNVSDLKTLIDLL
jgi:hypothetical protein